MTENTAGAVGRALAALLLLALAAWLVIVHGVPSGEEVRSVVTGAGAWAPVLYVGTFATLTLVAAPRNVLTTVGAALFGIVVGVVLSWIAALLGAVAGFALGRFLGSGAVARLTRGRLERVSATLRDRGTEAVLAARLMPVVPFTAVNYGAGALGVRLRHFVLGTAVGIVPGTVAYAVLGAYALEDPWLVGGVGAGLLVLFAGWVVIGRRRAERRQRASGECRRPAPESADAAL